MRTEDRNTGIALLLFFILFGLVIGNCACAPFAKEGPQGPAGQNGSNGQDGAPGQNGSDGSNGQDGADGTNGQDGTEVTIVRFCPGYAATSYPEIGFCIKNKIYATFWDGRQSWTAEVPPGSYRSTSTGAPCNFTVTANCGVAQ